MPMEQVTEYANVTTCTEDGVTAVKVIKFIDLFVDISRGRRETAYITCVIGDGVRFTAKWISSDSVKEDKCNESETVSYAYKKTRSAI